MFAENCLFRPHLRGLEENVFQVHERGFRTYQRDRTLIPFGQLHELRFEDLEADPLAQLERVYQGLGLEGWSTLRDILTPQLPALRSYRKNAYPDTPERMQRIYDRLRPIFEHYGYPHPAAAGEGHAACSR